ncbi:hypothetical protein QUB19_17875 [Microcoleus sp. B4-C5]|uniref:hypothetical protein n=1 Tax=unclassified Microcoleus TaxID=2642155 RepID=UPI002FCFDDEB
MIRKSYKAAWLVEGTGHLILISNSDRWSFTILRVAIALLNYLRDFGRSAVFVNKISSTSFQASNVYRSVR